MYKKSNNRIQDQGLYSAEVYQATAQRIADAYSAQGYLKVNFGYKEQKLKGQNTPVPELTATIGDKTSTSYFVLKDSLPQGTRFNQEQLTYYRPDIVSNRIATNLGIATQPPVATPVTPLVPTSQMPVPGQGVPSPAPINSVQAAAPASLSKAEMLVQQMAQGNQQQQVEAKVDFVPQNVFPTAPVVTVPVGHQNPYNVNGIENQSVADQLRQNKPAPLPSQASHNPASAKNLKQVNQKLQTTGNVHQALGKALKDMSKGEINPIQLYGDTLNIIGSFINGIPKGVHEARLQRITEQMKQVQEKRSVVDGKMNLLGDNLISFEPTAPAESNAVSQTNDISAPASNITPISDSSPVEPDSTSTKSIDPAFKAIEDLLKSEASIDDKLSAIEKTLDKILDQLIQIEKNLEAIQQSVDAQSQSNHKVLETEVETQVNAIVNDPIVEVPVATEIKTEIAAVAKTETEAKAEVEVPQFVVDPIPDEQDFDVSQEFMQMIREYDKNKIDQLNHHLSKDKLDFTVTDKSIIISDLNGIAASPIVTAVKQGGEWEIDSVVNEDKILELMDSFVQADKLVQDSPEQVQDQETKTTEITTQKEDFSLSQ